MTSKAISKKYKCDPWKMGMDRNPYIQVDIDRFIGYMYGEIENIKKLLGDPEITLFEENPHLRVELERQIDFYEGLIGTIKANSFK